MPNDDRRVAAPKSFKRRLAGGTVLALIPLGAIYYVLLVLPFIPDHGSGRLENILFWPVLASIVMALILRNLLQLDRGFFWSLPILSLLSYLLFAGASIVWAYNSDIAFSRLISHLLAFVAVVLPYALPFGHRTTLSRSYT